MYKPITNIGINFSRNFQVLNDFLISSNSSFNKAAYNSQLSSTIINFFETIKTLPAEIENLDSSITVLFEIDSTLNGYYGAKVFNEKSDSLILRLLKDIITLWFRFELMAVLERKNPKFLNINGIRSFYDSWKNSEFDNQNSRTEYDRIKDNVALIISSYEQINTNTQVLLFNMIGRILITLGFSQSNSEYYLRRYKNEIEERSIYIKNNNYTYIDSFSEILLNLYVMYQHDKNFYKNFFIEQRTFLKAVMFWSSNDEFTKGLFTSWNIYNKNDYYSELKPNEITFLKNNPNSMFNFIDNLNYNIGFSYLKFLSQKDKNPNLSTIYEPTQVFIFGSESVGKSSFLLSFFYESNIRRGKYSFGKNSVGFGGEYQSFYKNNLNSWNSNATMKTSGLSELTFWEDLNINCFRITDYNGNEVHTNSWDQKLQDNFLQSRGLIFVIDYNDYIDEIALRRKSAYFETFLSYWIQRNPKIKNIPVALVLNKIDLVLGSEIDQINETNIIPTSFKYYTIENYFNERFKFPDNELMTSPYKRLSDAVFYNENCNRNAKLQNVVENVMSNFGQFFSRALEITSNIQIFITSSLNDNMGSSSKYPFGASDVITWMASYLENIKIKESISTLKEEQLNLENEIKLVEQDIVRLHQNNVLIKRNEEEIRTLLESKGIMVVITRGMKIESLQQSNKEYEEKIKRVIELHLESFDANKRDRQIRDVEGIKEKKSDLLLALKEKIRLYELKNMQ